MFCVPVFTLNAICQSQRVYLNAPKNSAATGSHNTLPQKQHRPPKKAQLHPAKKNQSKHLLKLQQRLDAGRRVALLDEALTHQDRPHPGGLHKRDVRRREDAALADH